MSVIECSFPFRLSSPLAFRRTRKSEAPTTEFRSSPIINRNVAPRIGGASARVLAESLETTMAARITGYNINSLYRELENLTDDLRGLNQDKPPSEQELRSCPLLDQWSFGFLPAPCLVGKVYQHPALGTLTNIHTSELILIDPERRWARTWSRFYRLGNQQLTEAGIA